MRVAETDQASRRTLRARRKNPMSDKEQNDDILPTRIGQKETRSSQNFNQSKILVKFINSINKSYREYELARLEKDAEPHKKNGMHSESKPKKEGNSKNRMSLQVDMNIEEAPRKSRDSYLKSNGAGLEKNNNNRSDSNLKMIKQMAVASANTMMQLEKTITKESFNQNNCLARQVQNLAKNGGKPCLFDYKQVKRSQFHIAIAYNIFFTMMKKNGITGEKLDPTYQARRIKQESMRASMKSSFK